MRSTDIAEILDIRINQKLKRRTDRKEEEEFTIIVITSKCL